MSFLDEIPHTMDEAERRRYTILLLDSYKSVPGLIIAADAVKGTFTMQDEYSKEKKTHTLGPHAIRIMRR